jgi:glycosyltransferase involved in cell wall biosynthesis
MLTAVILAHDETVTLDQSLRSVQFADEVLVIADAPSTATLSVLTKNKAKVIRHPLQHDFSAQRNFALSQATGDWVIFVDADECVSPRLAKNIESAITDTSCVGFFLHRVDFLWQHKFKFGDLSQVYLLRLAKKDGNRWHGRVHEVWQVSGPTAKLPGDLIHTPHPTLTQFLQSINAYSSIRARELHDSGAAASLHQIIFYPLGKFVYLWLFRLGCLDGLPGLIQALTMSFYSFLVRGKLYLLSKGIPE